MRTKEPAQLLPTTRPARRKANPIEGKPGRFALSASLAADLLLRFALAAALSQSFILGTRSPFSLGFIAASGSGPGGAAALLGGLTGYLLGMGSAAALRYAAAAILLYAVEFAFFDQEVYKQRWFMAGCTLLITGLTGFLSLTGQEWSTASLIGYGSELLLAGMSCLFFQSFLEEGARPDRGSLLFLASALVLCLTRIHLLLGETTAAFLTLLTTRAGAGASAVTGGAMGLAVGLTTGGSPLLGAVLSFSGALTGGPSAKQGRLTTVLLFGGCALLSVAWVHGGPQMAIACAAAPLLFSVLPEKWLRRADAFTCKPTVTVAPAAKDRSAAASQARFRLEEQSIAFRTLYEHIHESVLRGETPESSTVIFDRVAERVCASCSHRPVCWSRNHTSTCQALTRALGLMLDRGSAELEDFPLTFRSRCMRLNDFLRVTNEELYQFWSRQQYRARLKHIRLAVCRQYAQLSTLLDSAAAQLADQPEHDPSGAAAAGRVLSKLGVDAQCTLQIDSRGRRTLELRGKDLTAVHSEEGSQLLSQALGVCMEPTEVFRVRQGQRLLFRQIPPLKATVAVASRQKQEHSVSGDNGIWFRDDNGIFWVVLCDGMGSGEAAARESRLLLTLLKDFLHAGVEAAPALTTLTGALSLRSQLDGGFTTVDLLRIDLYSGSAELFKLGGAPTYLRKNGAVSRLTGSSLPAGLETDQETIPDMSRFRLAAEDYVLLVTDGITDGDGDDWLRSMISRYQGDSPSELAQSVLASPGAGREDDRTVVAVRIASRA